MFALLLTAGCSHSGPSYSLSPASGTVSIDGKPLANALVVFHSETSPAAAGKTDSNGKFELETGGHGAGIAAGDFLVQINSTPETTDSSGKAISIPIVYSENGVEVVKITDGGENSFTFELKSKPRKSDYISTNPLEPR
ncbi:hypothetical protein C5Y97_02440 [Blastopirellula marina]|uniref:Carboxypeptidase regulatory-like domain-containing protein n=1 Tax=Blastopirellula marina TaxID=124 RepID=A0A2S8GBT1_9BACT|nr:hypothetical protein C5Y98_02440 [Blastopirellula marina]PTL46273.1 hypothetical protein C5Y97_02440 [Blastopirellula marina]